jgi:hypothetical protein
VAAYLFFIMELLRYIFGLITIKTFPAFFILKQMHLRCWCVILVFVIADASSKPERPVLELVGMQPCTVGMNYSVNISFVCSSTVSAAGLIHIKIDF